MTRLTIEEKMQLLNIKPIDDEVYLEHLKDFQLLGMDVSRWKYYKMYGNQPTFYSEGYLNKTSFEELKNQDEKNMKMFRVNASSIDRIKYKIDDWRFRMYCRYRAFIGE